MPCLITRSGPAARGLSASWRRFAQERIRARRSSLALREDRRWTAQAKTAADTA